jgi:hypothetical protein
MVLTSTIAFITSNIKKMKERYKEWKFHQNINVRLNEQQPYEGQLPMVNNAKNNAPLFIPEVSWFGHYIREWKDFPVLLEA